MDPSLSIPAEPVESEPAPITTYGADDIASFALKVEEVASPQCALWYEQ